MSQSAPAARPRIHLMDEVRGFAVLCMVVRHAFYLIGYLFDQPWAQAVFDFFAPVSPLFAGAFVLISGISSQLSHSNWARGARLLAVALGLTLATALVIPEEIIRFGVLHMLAVCMLVFALLQKPLARVPFGVGIAVCMVGFVLTAGLFFAPVPYVGVPGVPLLQICAVSEWGKFLFPLGIQNVGFYSSDYYPVFPWIFVFLAGTFLGRFAAAGRFPQWMYPARVPAFSWMGKHALVIYVLHQPVLYGIVWLISAIVP